MNHAKVRQSYWARNFVGWPRFSSFVPNVSHQILAKWEQNNKIGCTVTQNVDRLHQKAGSTYVIELHGSNYQVICLSCNHMTMRKDFQNELKALNPTLTLQSEEIRPDGDVDLTPVSRLIIKLNNKLTFFLHLGTSVPISSA